MSDITIASGTSHTLSAPLSLGSSITFANHPVVNGTLDIEPAGFIVTPVPLPGLGIGGTVSSYIPGDTIIVDNLEGLFKELNAGQNDPVFNSFIEIEAIGHGDVVIPPAGSGPITGSFAISILGEPIIYSTVIPAAVTDFIYAVEEEIFGPSVAHDTLTINLVTASPTMTDAVVTAVACFASGTRIATMRGEIAVETLRLGDQAILATGGTAPVKWIGHRDLDLTRHPLPHTVRPVRIAQGALGQGVPAHELVVSPDHALLLDDVLVQAKDLIDGVLIRQDKTITQICYYHVELPEHGILLANGAPAESYLDTGHRGLFSNSGAPLILHPDLMQIRREAESLAPLVTGGQELAAIRARLHAHKLMLGYTVNDTPVLCLKIGQNLYAPTIDGDRFTFALPAGTTDAVLASPVFVPAEIDPASNDRRVLGLALAELWLDGKQAALDSVIDGADLHARSPGDPHIWTRGAARLTLPEGTKSLTICVSGAPRLWRAA